VSADEARWAGRDTRKDVVRRRVWDTLTETGAGVGETRSRIPDFVGADRAASRLAGLPFWQAAALVKSNPDPAQAPVRLRALQDGKRVYTPVPELVTDVPFVELDPERLRDQGIAFEDVMYAEGALAHGRPLHFEQMEPMDVVVVGCVAVTRSGGRTGKGAGFADLELGIFRELGILPTGTPLVTTVHPLQVVDEADVVMERHDSPLDWIVTPDEVIETKSVHPAPAGVDWSIVQPDQFENIPFLRDVKARLNG
jgi:5-formyltetrahydrofolate cyclo-ligase